MPSNDLKQRKKATTQVKEDEKPDETSKPKGEEEEAKKVDVTERKSSALDVRTLACLLSVALCLVLSWIVLQQNARFADVEEKYKLLYRKTVVIKDLEDEIGEVSRKFESIQALLERVEGRAVPSQVEALQRDVSQLKEWASGLGEKRAKMEESLSALSEAVQAIEQRTGAVTSDVGAKVAAVRTDVRRMAGLEAEVEALLEQERELEMKVALAEKATARRIGDLLASSIDRVSALRGSAERDAESLERLRRRLAELAAADKELADRLLALEGGRARMLKTLTFASDLKPKVSTIRKDFALLDPLVSDLTLRIGRLAEDMMRREEEISQLRETFANLTAVQGDLRDVQRQLTQVPGVGEMYPQTNQPGE